MLLLQQQARELLTRGAPLRGRPVDMLGCADDGDSFLRKDRFREASFMEAERRAAQDEVRATCGRVRAGGPAAPGALSPLLQAPFFRADEGCTGWRPSARFVGRAVPCAGLD